MNYGKIGAYILLGSVLLTFASFLTDVLFYISLVGYVVSAVFCIISIVKRKTNPNESYKVAIACLIAIFLYVLVFALLFLSVSMPVAFSPNYVSDSAEYLLKNAASSDYLNHKTDLIFLKEDSILDGDALSEQLGFKVYVYFADNFPVKDLSEFNLIGNKIIYGGIHSSVLANTICGTNRDLLLESQSLVSYLQGPDNEYACHLILSK